MPLSDLEYLCRALQVRYGDQTHVTVVPVAGGEVLYITPEMPAHPSTLGWLCDLLWRDGAWLLAQVQYDRAFRATGLIAVR